MSICVGMSITVRPARRRTIARSTVSAIIPSSESHDQLHGVMPRVAGDAHVVDHLLDQKETPTARFLEAGELRLEVRRHRLGDVATAAEVCDANDDVTVARADLEMNGKFGVALVAVLDRVHRRLGDRGLEPVEPAAGEVEAFDAGGDAFHRLTLVAAHARDLEVVEDPQIGDARGPA